MNILQLHGADLVYEKYGEVINSNPSVRIAVIDTGVPLNKGINVVESVKLANHESSGHGEMVARNAIVFAPDKIEIVDINIALSHSSALMGIYESTKYNSFVANLSMALSSGTFVVSRLNYLYQNGVIWSSHLSSSANYPSVLTRSDIISRYTLEGFGKNVTVAIPCNDKKQKISGAVDPRIPSIGVLAPNPSAATAVLSSACAFLKILKPELTHTEAVEILYTSGDQMDGYRWLRLDNAVELMGFDLSQPKIKAVAIETEELIEHISENREIERVDIHFKDGEIISYS